MTVQEIIESDKEMLIPKDIAPILGCDPYTISVAARQAPELLGFNTIVLGTRTKIPRRAFLEYIGVKTG